jgi:hypothetical protein
MVALEGQRNSVQNGLVEFGPVAKRKPWWEMLHALRDIDRDAS